MSVESESLPRGRTRTVVDRVAVRFAGDSGDGMQLAGDRFATTSAVLGSDVVTLAEYPAEIRAPAGSVGGVSGYQLCLGSSEVYTAGDEVDILVAMNPAALKANVAGLRAQGMLIVNADAFSEKNLEKAGYTGNPLTDGSLAGFQVIPVPLAKATKETLKGGTLGAKEQDRCKNFFALGLVCWLLDRSLEPTLSWIAARFAGAPALAEANRKVLAAGWDYGETTELFTAPVAIRQEAARRPEGLYRYVSGNVAAALGLLAAADRAELPLFLGSYPITPATDILQELSKHRNFGVTVFQAEDEIAAIGAAIGAAFAGSLAVTTTSGPGMALKSEFLNLAVMTELPLVVVNVQRAGPSTGLPTKTEQADLAQALWGRNGESPLVVLAARSPSDNFDAAVEAARVALKYMTPVVLLSDGYLANGSEPWRIPEPDELPAVKANARPVDAASFQPYARDPVTLARPWAVPGMAGFEHRIGGLEKRDGAGGVDYDPLNHAKMVRLRAEKVARVAAEIPPCAVVGHPKAKLLVVGWGSTYGAIREAVVGLAAEGYEVAATHLRYLSPLPSDLGGLLERHPRVLVPENNLGQLAGILRSTYLCPVESLEKVEGAPFKVREIEDAIKSRLR
jgi:2-oxoglutarate ferredoxin oxidoreductase subunit alpha